MDVLDFVQWPYLGAVTVTMTIFWPKSRYRSTDRPFHEFVEWVRGASSPVRHFAALKKNRRGEVVAVTINLSRSIPDYFKERSEAAAKLLVEYGFTSKSEVATLQLLKESGTEMIVIEPV